MTHQETARALHLLLNKAGAEWTHGGSDGGASCYSCSLIAAALATAEARGAAQQADAVGLRHDRLGPASGRLLSATPVAPSPDLTRGRAAQETDTAAKLRELEARLDAISVRDQRPGDVERELTAVAVELASLADTMDGYGFKSQTASQSVNAHLAHDVAAPPVESQDASKASAEGSQAVAAAESRGRAAGLREAADLYDACNEWSIDTLGERLRALAAESDQ